MKETRLINKKLLTSAILILFTLTANILALSKPGDRNVSGAPLTGGAEPFGILIARNFAPVWVNENFAVDGMTVLSGSQIRSGKTSAVIEIQNICEIELCPAATVKLLYSRERVDVSLVNGQASLTTFRNIVGVLSIVDGRNLRTDVSLRTSSVGIQCAAGDSKPSGTNYTADTIGWNFTRALALAAAVTATVNTIIVLPGNGRMNVGQVRP